MAKKQASFEDSLTELEEMIRKMEGGSLPLNEALAAYEEKLKFYALIRTLPGITFSEVIPDEIRPHLVQEVTAAFLRGYEQLERMGMQD